MVQVPLDEAYLVWLYSQVGSVKLRNRSKTYWTLLRLLYCKEFEWVERIPKDENRAKDGIDLRREFLDETGTRLDDPDFLYRGCSVLEMFVALARQLEFEGGGTQGEWFWVLIDNLGLTECTDTNPPEEDILYHIIDKVIDREYAPNGAGGLFPLQHPSEDQRDVEIWYQANAYLLERL